MSLSVLKREVTACNISGAMAIAEMDNIAVVYLDVDDIKLKDQPMPPLSAKKRNQLKRSIMEHGIRYPIQIDSDYCILDGRNRWEIAKELGFKKVPCIICNTNSNPLSANLKYELEICRRSLTVFEEDEISKEKESFEREFINHMFEKALDNIVPELHDMLREKFAIYRDIKTVLNLARLPKSLQAAMVNEGRVPIYTKEDKKKIETMEKELKELREKVSRMKELEEKYKIIEEEARLLKSGLQERVKAELERREKEIAEKYIDMAPEEFRKMLEEERKKIEREFADELKKTQEDITRMSFERAKYSEEAKRAQEELKEMEKKLEQAIQFANKFKKQVEVVESVVKEIVTPESFVDRLVGVNEDIKALSRKINAVSKELTGILKGVIKMKASNVMVDYDMFVKPLSDIEKTVSELVCNEIENVVKEFKKYIQQ